MSRPIPPHLRHVLGGDWAVIAPTTARFPRPVTGDTYDLELPIRLVSEANTHASWRGRAKRAKEQRQAVDTLWRASGYWTARWVVKVAISAADVPTESAIPRKVTITRLAPRELDSDNLQGAAKAVRDQVAQLLGFNDRNKACEWWVTQEKRKEYGVKIRVEF